VVAAPLTVHDGMTVAKISAGVRQPRVLRGRLLSRCSTAARSAAVWTDRSVLLGKHWRSRPLVPRCQGLAGGRSRCRGPGAARSGRAWPFPSLVPGQGEPGGLREAGRHPGQLVAEGRGVVAGGQVDQAQVAAGPVGQGADRGSAGPADDEVSFPVADPVTACGLVGPLVDQHGRGDEAGLALECGAAALAQRPPGRSFLVSCLLSPPLPP
jgi:hypothetical protein